jgi:hypothetical protein
MTLLDSIPTGDSVTMTAVLRGRDAVDYVAFRVVSPTLHQYAATIPLEQR